MKKTISFFEKEHFGRLFIRIVLGVLFVTLGVHYFTEGHATLSMLGEIFQVLGITNWPLVCGILSATSLILFGMCYLIGFYYRSSCFILLCIFLMKTTVAWRLGYNFFDEKFLNNLLLTSILFSSMFIGAGRFSSDGH